MEFFNFFSGDYSEEKRREAFEEIFSPLCSMNIHVDNAELHTQSRIAVHENFAIADTRIHNHYCERSYSHIVDGDDSMLLVLPRAGAAGAWCAGVSEQVCRPGEMFIVPTDQRFGTRDESYVHALTVTVPRDWMERKFLHKDLRIGKVQRSADLSALQLLFRYVDHVFDAQKDLDQVAKKLVELQFLDLLGLILDVDLDNAHLARQRGLKDVQFHFICEHVKKHVMDSNLDIHSVAREHKLSPQSVRKLFRQSGTTFTEYLNGLRLDWVYRSLANPALQKKSISALAYTVGFNNLAWFNRAFKQRFNAVPSEVLRESRNFQ